MKHIKRLISKNENILYRYDNKLIPIVRKKELIEGEFYGINFYYNRIFSCVTLKMIKDYHKNLYKLSVEHNMILYRFCKEKKKIKCREASENKNKMYHIMQDFMNHNNLCYDIKAHILSFIF